MAWPPADGERYRPSNGSEALGWHDAWCNRCSKLQPCADHEELDCQTWRHVRLDNGPEWQWQAGKPVCTEFQALRPLGVDGLPLEPPDPRQLTLDTGGNFEVTDLGCIEPSDADLLSDVCHGLEGMICKKFCDRCTKATPVVGAESVRCCGLHADAYYGPVPQWQWVDAKAVCTEFVAVE